MAGEIECANFPSSCVATVSVLPPDTAVPDSWRPPEADPIWEPDFTDGYTYADHLVATPVGDLPVLAPGRHLVVVSLLGSSDVPSINPDGTVATILLARCSAMVDARPSALTLTAVVTIAPKPDVRDGGGCSIRIMGPRSSLL